MDNLHTEFDDHEKFLAIFAPYKDELVERSEWYENATRNGLLAEDILQETMTQLYAFYKRHNRVVTEPLHIAAMVMFRHYGMYVRRKQDMDMNIEPIPEYWDEEEAPPASLVMEPLQEREAVMRDVQWAIAQLTPREQQFVRWLYWEELSEREIGRRIGRSYTQVSRIVSPIREKLRQLLADYAPERPSDKTSLLKSA